MNCTVSNCGQRAHARGLCPKHLERLKRTGTTDRRVRPTLEERFWSKVERRGPDECWEWTGGRTTAGYGLIREGGRGTPALYAHRLSFEWSSGPIPEGYYVCHRCDNPPCVNAGHLFAGSPLANHLDAKAKGRHSKPPVGARGTRAK